MDKALLDLATLQQLPAQVQELQQELASLHWSPQRRPGPLVEAVQLSDRVAEAYESDSSEGWPPGLELPQPDFAATELHALAGHLLAADALAARVVELERYAGQASDSIR